MPMSEAHLISGVVVFVAGGFAAGFTGVLRFCAIAGEAITRATVSVTAIEGATHRSLARSEVNERMNRV